MLRSLTVMESHGVFRLVREVLSDGSTVVNIAVVDCDGKVVAEANPTEELAEEIFNAIKMTSWED